MFYKDLVGIYSYQRGINTEIWINFVIYSPMEIIINHLVIYIVYTVIIKGNKTTAFIYTIAQQHINFYRSVNIYNKHIENNLNYMVYDNRFFLCWSTKFFGDKKYIHAGVIILENTIIFIYISNLNKICKWVEK
jgi:hypothetical protein